MNAEALKRIEKAIAERATKLNLSGCELTIIPKDLVKLPWLKSLDLSSNKLGKIEGLEQLINLTKLRLYTNQLSKIEGLDHLTNLSELWLNNNQLSKIEGLDHLTNLSELWLNNNQLSKIEGLDHLTNLSELSLYNNQLNKIEGLDHLTNLSVLSLYNNQLNKIEGLDHLNNLSVLWLSNNRLNKIEGLNHLNNLSVLRLYNNRLSKIEGLDHLTNLSELSLSNNRLSKIEGLDHLTNLSELSLYNNQLSKIEGLDHLNNLSVLSLNNNKLSKIEGLDHLTNLSVLRLGNNQLSKIEGLEKLMKLRKISLQKNKVTNILPLKFLLNTELRISLKNYNYNYGIYLKDNPITNPPLEIVAQGNKAILRYWDQLEANKDAPVYLNEARVLIVGEGEAGKTTLQRKLLDRNAPLPEKDNRTRKIVKKQIVTQLANGTDFTLHLWDFGGQNIQYYAHQFFLSTDAIYLLVTDERRQSHNFVYWLHIIELLGKDSPVFLLQNQKGDAIADGGYNIELQQHFPVLQEERSINLKNISNLNDPPEGVIINEEIRSNTWAFEKLIKAITEQAANLPINQAPRPESFRKVRELVISERANTPYMLLADLLQKEGAPGREDFIADLKTLTLIGECVYNSQDPTLRDWVFLNPQWIIDAMYRLVDNSELEKNHGQFTSTEAENILAQSEYAGMTEQLLRLLCNFYLCYQVPDTDRYIAPMLLPNMKEAPWPHDDCFQLRFSYQFLPYGILTRLICRLYDWIPDRQVWRDAVILELPDAAENTAYLRESFDQKQIILDVHGPECMNMAKRIHEVILDIHRDAHYENLQFDELVPCPCKDCIARGKKPHFHFSFLRKKIQKKSRYVDCPLCANDIPLVDLHLKERTQNAFILSHADDQAYADVLEKSLATYKRNNLLELHSEKTIPPGHNRSDFITSKLSLADVVFVLLSPNLNSDDQLIKSVIDASERQAQELVIIKIANGLYDPIIEDLQCLPRDGSTIRTAQDPDAAWMKIVQETGGLLFPDQRMDKMRR